MYEVVVTIHILSGLAWVGAGFVFWLGAGSIRAQRGQQAAVQTMERLDKATMLVGFAPPLVLVTGVIQVLMSEQHDWSDLWVILAIVLVVAALALGAGFGERWLKHMLEAQEQDRRLFDRWLRFGWLEIAAMAAIVALMVYKPV